MNNEIIEQREKEKSDEHKSMIDPICDRSHLIRVASELRQCFDGLGSPASNDLDRKFAAEVKASLMFGEILFHGVSRIFDSQHLDGANAGILYDLGSGCGRLCIQAFLQFTNLHTVVGVELTSVRSKVGFTALTRLSRSTLLEYEGKMELTTKTNPFTQYTLTVQPSSSRHTPIRNLEFRQMNLFDCHDAFHSDILIAETNIDASMQYDFLHFLSHCKTGCRLLTYNNLDTMFIDVTRMIETNNDLVDRKGRGERMKMPIFPWKRLSINTFDDKFSASWGEIHFHLFECRPTQQQLRTRGGFTTISSSSKTSSQHRSSVSRIISEFSSVASDSSPRSNTDTNWNVQDQSSEDVKGMVKMIHHE